MLGHSSATVIPKTPGERLRVNSNSSLTSAAEERLRLLLLDYGSVRPFPRGSMVYSLGEQASHFGLCLHGVVKIVMRDALQRRAITHLVRPGRLVGFDALDQPAHRSDAIALTDVEVLAVPRENFARLNTEILALLLGQAAKDIIELQTRIRDIALKPARARVASILLEQSQSDADHVGPGASLLDRGEISRQDMAALAGMTPETFIRILSTFRSRGLVSAEGRRLHVEDLEKLRSLAGRDH